MATPISLPTTNTARIVVLGSGSWGTTLARILALAGKDVALWSRDPNKASSLNQNRKITKPLPMELPTSIEISSDLEKCLYNRQIILFCCTSQSLREVASQVKELLKRSAPTSNSESANSEFPVLVSAAKGLELKTFSRMSEILESTIEGLPVCSLSGPNLAAEILSGLPTASVIACKQESIARFVQKELTVPTLRFYSNTDVIGVELGGSFKNVIAIAAGGVDGLALGCNAKSALMTRGLAEMTRLAVSLGAHANTLAGLAGLGDLVTTCSSPLSRNYQLGYKIAQGASIQDAKLELGAVAEGVNTAFAICELAKKLEIELPIAQQVESALKGQSNPQKAIMNLMNRPLVSE